MQPCDFHTSNALFTVKKDNSLIVASHRPFNIYWESLLGYRYLPWSIFPLLLGASIGNVSSQSFIDTFSVGS